ncbi:MAG: YggS family pyridoxal phosphate-dependent enzyme [Lachnospiraceae bacterium]|nr:YggS family pyridoxal phosphate-dependent enzyme [Lachnospiraceae bacterium]MCI9369454.1 YggS family pyridoxal phosphate-dependent enzyme [Lachnospiraceae bacterium]
MLIENYKSVLNEVMYSCEKAGRNENEVTLIAVSKTKPVCDIEELYRYGVREFGENKVQELCDKYEKLPKDIKWHMIGHLQRNKVKYLIDKVEMIHSVDSVRLAKTIEEEAAKKQLTINILIEVNVAEEESKFGLKYEETLNMIKEISDFAHIQIRGLMTIAPFTKTEEDNRIYFKKLKKLAVDIDSKNIHNVSMDFLSMGMTGDYHTAIEEGATHVRVGTAIFGERNYNL